GNKVFAHGHDGGGIATNGVAALYVDDSTISKNSAYEGGGVVFFSSRRRHTRSVSAFLLNRSSDLGNSFINTMKNINHTRSSISDDIRNILCSSANMRRAIPLILRLLMN